MLECLSKVKEKVTIATHNGKFHADDVFAVASLRLLLGRQDIKIVRTRDKGKIEKADYVVDVGGEHNPEKNRFDHHQRGAGKRENQIPYAAFGLVWARYGEQICSSVEVAKRIDQKLAQGIDAGDNGIGITKPLFDGVFPYGVHNIINLFAPTYKEKDITYDTEFIRVVDWAMQLLKREIKKTTDFIEAENKIKEEYKEQEGEPIVIFRNQNDFEQSTIIRNALQDHTNIIYIVLYRHESDNWQVVAMNKDKNTFETRKPLLKKWQGLRDEELIEASGVEDAIFCHSGGFLCVASSMAGAIKMAELALEE